MTGPVLSPDCDQCASLCCVALAFDRSDLFAIDKPAGTACPNLNGDGQCNIHEDLDRKGFGGCVRFDCLGAGQRVTNELFGGRSWQSEPDLAGPMFDAFSEMRKIHEMLLLLQTASRLELDAKEQALRVDLEQDLYHLSQGSVENLLRREKRQSISTSVHDFLTSLRGRVANSGNLRFADVGHT